MAAYIIPIDRLSPEALKGVIEEFISRDGTDYGEKEASPQVSFFQVKRSLETGLAVLVYDNETETTNVLRADDPILKTITASSE